MNREVFDRLPLLLTLAVWGSLLLSVLYCIAAYARNVPLAEDWLMVPPLTGQEPDLLAWAWAQNNEHRLPLPRLVHLGLLKLTGGDFRAGMTFSTLAMGALSLAMIGTARRLRGGRSAYSDAFFPLLFLHLGHWPNLVWSWQIQFTMATAVTSTILLLVCALRESLDWTTAVLGSLALLALPLSGGSGLAFVPPMALGAAWLGWSSRRESRGASLLLMLGALGCVLLTGLYFLDYERPGWNPPSPGVMPSLRTAGQLLAMSLGPAASLSWKASFSSVALLVSATAVLLVLRGFRERPPVRAIGFLLFLGGALALLLGMGWTRAALVPQVGLPMRYAILTAPILASVYFVWEIYGRWLAARAVPYALLAACFFLLPFNVEIGLGWRDWYVSGMNAFEEDLRSGVPREELARRHGAFLLHWDEAALSRYMSYLHDAGVGPFAAMRDEPSLFPNR